MANQKIVIPSKLAEKIYAKDKTIDEKILFELQRMNRRSNRFDKQYRVEFETAFAGVVNNPTWAVNIKPFGNYKVNILKKIRIVSTIRNANPQLQGVATRCQLYAAGFPAAAGQPFFDGGLISSFSAPSPAGTVNMPNSPYKLYTFNSMNSTTVITQDWQDALRVSLPSDKTLQFLVEPIEGNVPTINGDTWNHVIDMLIEHGDE